MAAVYVCGVVNDARPRFRLIEKGWLDCCYFACTQKTAHLDRFKEEDRNLNKTSVLKPDPNA